VTLPADSSPGGHDSPPRPPSSDISADLDLEPALKQMHEWGLSDGDLGFAYWYQVAKLLKSASALKARVADLEAEAARKALQTGKRRKPP